MRSCMLAAGSWEPGRGQHFLDVMQTAAARRNLTRADATFVDIGANVGWFTLLLLSHG